MICDDYEHDKPHRDAIEDIRTLEIKADESLCACKISREQWTSFRADLDARKGALLSKLRLSASDYAAARRRYGT